MRHLFKLPTSLLLKRPWLFWDQLEDGIWTAPFERTLETRDGIYLSRGPVHWVLGLSPRPFLSVNVLLCI